MSDHNHTCHCGAYDLAHRTGEHGCYREMCPAPRVLANGFFEVAGVIINPHSLYDQRLYHKHPCGCWSRAKDGSSNSIEA